MPVWGRCRKGRCQHSCPEARTPRRAVAGPCGNCMLSFFFFFKKLPNYFLQNIFNHVKNLDLIVRALGGHLNINPNPNVFIWRGCRSRDRAPGAGARTGGKPRNRPGLRCRGAISVWGGTVPRESPRSKGGESRTWDRVPTPTDVSGG